MTKPQRQKYDTFVRVSEFGKLYEMRFPASSKGGQMFAKVAEAAARIEKEGVVRLEAGSKGYHTASARRDLKRWMLHFAAISRDLTRTGTPGIAPLKMPTGGNDATLIATAQRFLEAGSLFSDELVQRGLGEQWASRFKEAIDAFAAHRGERRVGRFGAKTARTNIEAALKGGMDALLTLDSIVAIVLANDPLMPTWQQARRMASGKASTDGPVPAVAPESTEVDLQKAS